MALTASQVKVKLKRQGVTIAQWADTKEFPRSAVYRVLNGVDKANFGRAHDIAVALGLKEQDQSEQLAA